MTSTRKFSAIFCGAQRECRDASWDCFATVIQFIGAYTFSNAVEMYTSQAQACTYRGLSDDDGNRQNAIGIIQEKLTTIQPAIVRIY